MKALISREAGGPETLVIGDIPDPVPGPGELLVAVHACAINFPDVLIIEDKYQFKPQRPFSPGAEISGTVLGMGEGVVGWSTGDRLIATATYGCLAEKAVVPAAQAFPLGEDQDKIAGAGLLLTYATTLHALQDRAQLKSGETLLVLGAAGGVGLAAIEIGKVMGARVIAAVSSEDKADAARAAGADDTLIYGRAPFDREQSRALADQFKQAAGTNGVDVVYDPVGGDYAEPAIRSLAWEGRYLVVGFPAGIPRIPLNLPLLKSCDIRGVFWGAFATRAPEANRRNVAKLLDWWREGRINPRVSGVWPLDQGGSAIARMAARGAIGKLVVQVADSAAG
jgi:NADPH:quinone reductase